MEGASLERALKMHELYSEGATLEEVGQRYGLTRERVRQIFGEAGLPTIALAERHRRILEARASEIVESYRELGDLRACAQALDLPLGTVERVLRARPPVVKRSRPPRRVNRYSDEELLSMLGEASRALGDPLSVKAFDGYARGRALGDGRAWPTSQTPTLRFGGWRAALQTAGLPANPSTPIAGQRRFDESRCMDALRLLARELGGPPTVAAYERARASDGALPSATLLRRRHGSWYEVLERAGLCGQGKTT